MPINVEYKQIPSHKLQVYLFGYCFKRKRIAPNKLRCILGIDLSQGAGPATTVLCLMNMVAEDELRDDHEYEGKQIDGGDL